MAVAAQKPTTVEAVLPTHRPSTDNNPSTLQSAARLFLINPSLTRTCSDVLWTYMQQLFSDRAVTVILYRE